MFDKFGEFDSFSEINELAENLLNEGDIESLKVVAKENGIQADFVNLYTNGEIPELCDKLTAARLMSRQQSLSQRKSWRTGWST